MNILIVGDSFAYGHGCDDRVYYYDEKTKQWIGDKTHFFRIWDQSPSLYCYGSLLQNEFSNFTVKNKSSPGADNMSIFNFLIENIENADLIFYNASTYTRMQVLTEHLAEEPVPWVIGQHEWNPDCHSSDYNKAHEYFLKYLYHETWFQNITLSAIYAAYGLAHAKNKKFYWSCPYVTDRAWLQTNKRYPIWVKKFEAINYCRIESLNGFQFPKDFNLPNKYLCADNHANNLGHSYYYENVIKPVILKEVII